MKYTVTIYKEIDRELYTEWESVWDKSDNGHIFNSPYWYCACTTVEPQFPKLILVCRDSSGNLVGILPLIIDRKYGFKVYLSPGHKYLDKSTLFLVDNSPQVFSTLLSHLQELGNFYLTELSEDMALSLKSKKSIGVSLCSEGRSLDLGSDPLRNLSKENKRRLLKRLRDNPEIVYSTNSDDLLSNISKAAQVERNSNKTKKHKDIFTDNYLVALCKEINKLKSGILHFAFLSHNSEPVCYKYGFLTHGIYHYSNTAYSDKYQKLSLGRLLMIKVLAELEGRSIKSVDFSRGDTAFKREFSSQTYRQFTAYHLTNELSMYFWRFMYYVKDNVIKL